jgi:hypothetical protein
MFHNYFKPVEIDGIKIYRHVTPKSQDIDSIHIEVVNENSKFLGMSILRILIRRN